MVVNIVKRLTDIGLSAYEARAYVALIEKNPVTAYELAKTSGIPTSKIYEVISRLSEKELVLNIGENGGKKYIPREPEEFIEGREAELKALKDDLAGIKKGEDVSYIWNVRDYEYLMNKAMRMIVDAEKTLLLSIWNEDMTYLEQFLRIAEKKKVDIAIIHFGTTNKKLGQIYQHPIEDTLYAEKGGRGLVVISDSKEVLIGTVYSNNKVEGAWSMNRGFVTLAEDYIKHDVYMMKIVRRFDTTLKGRFGYNYEKLRDIFKDEEAV